MKLFRPQDWNAPRWHAPDTTYELHLSPDEVLAIGKQLERSVIVDSGSPLSKLLKVLQEKA